MTARDGAWIVRPRPRLAPRLRLFCIPHGGGTTSVFAPWPGHFDTSVEVCGIELPGRQRRSSEAPFVRVKPLVDELEAVMRRYVGTPFALFGHCTGALIAFELARRLTASGRPPVRLFASCSRAPQLPNPDRSVHALADEDLVAELGRLGGTAPDVMEHPELLALLLPTLRADFELAETYAYRDGPRLPVPICAFGGLEDETVVRSQVEPWSAQTAAGFSLEMLPGDHYLIETAPQPLLARIAAELDAAMAAASRP